MAYTSGIFDAVDQGGGNYDRMYSAANFAHYFSLLVKNGVFPDPSTGMQVKASPNPDMHVSIQPGSGWVNGYYITVEANAPEQLTVPTANPSLSRIDSVIMGLNYVDREIQLYIKSGAVSASPSAVSLQRDNDLYELELAQITVSAGVASISQANITDMRQNTSRCGIVAGTIDQIDTEDLFAQYNDAFQTWFEDIKTQLSGDIATNLQNQINALKTEKVNVSDKASTEQANAGTDDTKWMTPKKVANEIESLSYLKNKILSNNTAALFGLGTGAVPDDVLAVLGKYKQYWWRRRIHTVTWEISTTSTGNSITVSSNTAVQYADSIHVEFDGTIILDNPKTSVPANYDNRDAFNNAIKNYWAYGNLADRSNVWYGGNPVTNWSNDNANSFTNLKQVIATKTSENIGEWEFIQATNRNAYPDSGNKDGFDYQYIGVPLDNAVTAPKFETGSYAGTGTYGRANPNTLTFGFVPKFVWIYEWLRDDDWYNAGDITKVPFGIIPERDFGRYFPPCVSTGASNTAYAKRVGTTLSWYNEESAGAQLNYSNSTYYYIAIG